MKKRSSRHSLAPGYTIKVSLKWTKIDVFMFVSEEHEGKSNESTEILELLSLVNKEAESIKDERNQEWLRSGKVHELNTLRLKEKKN